MDEKPKDISENAPDVGQFAVGKLAEHLEIGVTLAHHCEIQAGKAKGDRLGPVYAAARLMRANAAVAEALATVGGIERRRRSIVERIQSPDPRVAELNSGLQKEKTRDEERMERLRLLNERIMNAGLMRPGVHGTSEEIAQFRRDLEAELTLFENEGMEAGHG